MTPVSFLTPRFDDFRNPLADFFKSLVFLSRKPLLSDGASSWSEGKPVRSLEMSLIGLSVMDTFQSTSTETLWILNRT